MKRNKKNFKKGFTLIEVILFLGISGAIFAMVMTGISTSTARRRYNDSVNDIVEQIRNAYAATISVENVRTDTGDQSSYFCSISSAFINKDTRKAVNYTTPDSKITATNDNYPGRSKCAVYGQVITFGEQDSTVINRYDIIGLADIDDRNDIDPDDSDAVLKALKKIGANIVTLKQGGAKAKKCTASLAGTTSSYLPQWGATIENKTAKRTLYKGAIMIARSPVSGTVHTFVYTGDGTFEVQKWLSDNASKSTCDGFYQDDGYFITKAMANDELEKKKIDICVGSEDLFGVAGRRRAIRIHKDGSTESAVELLSEGDSVGICES